MQWMLMGSPPSRLLVSLTLIVTTALGLSVTGAQTTTSGYWQYYVEFRSRQAWDYGHTFGIRPRRRDAGQEKRCWAFAKGR